jgi:hypothetical protein
MSKRIGLGTAILFGLSVLANGLFMLILPSGCYFALPSVAGTGPLTQYSIRDIGFIFLFIGDAFIVGATHPDYRVPLWTAASLWLAGDALFHIWEVAVGISGPSVLLRDFPAVTLPAVIGGALSLWAARERRIQGAALHLAFEQSR